MPEDTTQSLREHLLELLNGGHAHATFEDAIEELPPNLYGAKPASFPHSPWMLLEHLRIAQRDILEFSRNKSHESPKWPEGYWPKSAEPPSTEAWQESVDQFESDLKAMRHLIKNPKTDLFAKIPWGDGQTILREALLVADHNAYHIAQLVDVRRLLGAWE
jgi:hypothetical protein